MVEIIFVSIEVTSFLTSFSSVIFKFLKCFSRSAVNVFVSISEAIEIFFCDLYLMSLNANHLELEFLPNQDLIQIRL